MTGALLPSDFRRRRPDGSDLPDIEDLDEGALAELEALDPDEVTDPDPAIPIVYLEKMRAVVPDAAVDFYANLADGMPQERKDEIAQTLLKRIEVDKESRKKRDDQYAEGIRRTGVGDDAPGGATSPGASKAVHPVMAEACVDFAASEMEGTFPARRPDKGRHRRQVRQ